MGFILALPEIPLIFPVGEISIILSAGVKKKHFRNVSSVVYGVSENPAGGLCNLLILNKFQSAAVGIRPRLRRDCYPKPFESSLTHTLPTYFFTTKKHF